MTVSLDHDWLQQQEHVAKWVPYRTSSIHILLHLTSVVVRLDPDSAFHFDGDLDPDPDPVPTFAQCEKSDFKKMGLDSSASLHVSSFSSSS